MLGQNILLKRLQNIAADRPLAVVVGSALSTTWREKPLEPLGVPGVWGMVAEVRAALAEVDAEAELDTELANVPSAGHYQTAFEVAQGVLGSRRVDEIVQTGVLKARLPAAPALFDGDGDGAPHDWHLPQGTAALGRLLAARRHPFTGPVLTTNFDPLLTLAVKAAGGVPERRILGKDGALPDAAESEGRPQIVHLHGYWRAGPTLHTSAQLARVRPALRGALRTLLRGHVVLVTGYGGWDDVFMRALADVAAEPGADTEILWGLFGKEADARHHNQALLQRYEGAPGFVFYCGVDAHVLFDTLAPAPSPAAAPARPTRAAAAPADESPIKMGQPGFAVPTFTLERGEMIGGEALIAELHALLAHGEAGIGQAAAVGLGGLGKSRLAWEYAHAHQTDYPGGVLWFDADGQSDLDGQLADIARTLRWVGPASDDKGALDVARPALRDLRDALIIFDNVEDIERVRHLRPKQGCAFLVTSRQPQNMRVLDMKVLPPDAGVALLEQVWGRPLDDPADREAARAISVWADGLPLALELIGAYMGRRPMAKWPDTLQRLRAHALKARPLKPAKAGLDEPIHGGQTVDAALQLEPQLLDEYPALGRALDMLSGLAPTSMGLDLLSTLVDADDPEDLTEALEVACTLRIVIRSAGEPPRYRMHRLVRAVYRANRNDDPLDQPAMAQLVQWFRAKRRDQTGITAFGGEADHLETARMLCEEQPRLYESSVLYWLEAYIPHARGNYRAALEIVERAQSAWKGAQDSPTALEMATDQAALQSALGDVRVALDALRTISDRAAAQPMPGDIRIDILRLVASQQHALGRNASARETAAKVLALAQAAWGSDHWQTAVARSDWAAYTAEADSNDAEDVTHEARQALDLLRAMQDSSDHRVFRARSNLSNCLSAAGRYADAIELGREILTERERFLGPTHPLTLFAARNLATFLNNRGEWSAARAFANMALGGFQRLYGAHHRDTVVARLQVILSMQDRLNAAHVALRLKKMRDGLAPDHPERSRLDRVINQYTPTPRRRRGKKRRR